MLTQYLRSPLPLLTSGLRFWRQHGRRGRRARALRQCADGLRLQQVAGWQPRSRRLYRRSIQTLGELGGPPAPADLEPALAAQLAARHASEPYRALLRSLVAWAIVLAAVAVLAYAVAVAVSPRLRARLFPRDLAAGRPWVASSSDLGLPASGVGPAADGTVFFHTTVMKEPTVEIDLGGEHLIRAVRVDNRTDCCGDRALPLNVEVWDGTAWRLIAQRRAAFSVWKTEVAPVRAQRIRLRRLGTAYFHLNRVSVYGE